MPPLSPAVNGVARSCVAGCSAALPPNIDPFVVDSIKVGAAAAAASASGVGGDVVERISFVVLAFALGGDVFVDDVDGFVGAEEDGDGNDGGGTG